MKAADLDKLTTTTITRCRCNMVPDPCDHKDYLITGENIYDDVFDVRVHHRGRGCWLLVDGDLRQTWMEFRSLQEVIYHLEGCN